ncbi:MAG: hypothetical protein NDI88_16940 [Lysobacter sp.]|nr:hypothetical protein [Lysobacter sp.]
MGTNAEYLAGMQVQLKKWDADVDELLTKSKKADGEVRTAYARRLKELRLCRKAAQKSYEEVRVATGATADRTQAGMQASWETMKSTLEKVTSDLEAMGRKDPVAIPESPAEPPPPQEAPIQQESAP